MAIGVPTPRQPAATIRVRRSASRLTAGQLSLLRQAFEAVKGIADDRGYAFWAGIHGLPLPIGCDNAHGTPFFLPWHRAYLYFFERALRDQVPDAMLTWWDWSARAGGRPSIPAAFSDRQVGTEPNPLFSAPVDRVALEQGLRSGLRVPANTVRRPGSPGAPLLPTRQEVQNILALRDFLDFSAQVEGLHDRVHVWVGGHMGMIPFASFDPLFWAHHTMVDRIWRLWQLRHRVTGPPAALLDQALPPFRMTVRQTLDVTALGYDYAMSSASTTVGGA
jgi:tyrosinase